MTFEQLRALAEAPSWVILVVLVGLILAAFVKGWVVPGFIYRASEKRAEDLKGIVDTSIKGLTATVEGYADDVAWDLRDRHEIGPARKRPPRG